MDNSSSRMYGTINNSSSSQIAGVAVFVIVLPIVMALHNIKVLEMFCADI